MFVRLAEDRIGRAHHRWPNGSSCRLAQLLVVKHWNFGSHRHIDHLPSPRNKVGQGKRNRSIELFAYRERWPCCRDGRLDSQREDECERNHSYPVGIRPLSGQGLPLQEPVQIVPTKEELPEDGIGCSLAAMEAFCLPYRRICCIRSIMGGICVLDDQYHPV